MLSVIQTFIDLCHILPNSRLGTACLPIVCIEVIPTCSFDRLSFSEMFLILQHIFQGTVSMDLNVQTGAFSALSVYFPQ